MMLASVAAIAMVLTYCFVLVSVRVALGGAGNEQLLDEALTAVTLSVGVVLAGVVMASAGAAAYLRGTISRSLSEMQAATAAIAHGSFGHRIASPRSDELGLLANSIDTMAAELNRLESARQKLLATVSHELRTPLTVIRGHAFTLGRNERDHARRDRFALIDSESARLAALIDDLLQAATLQAQPVRLERRQVAPRQLLGACAERFREASQHKDVQVRTVAKTGRRTVSVDIERFGQVASNLVSNAIAHAPAGSVVQLRALARQSSIRISVVNGGPGIEPERVGDLFEPFVQGRAPTGAVGLGLAIASELVRAHGSELKVRSRDGRTEFWFDLPSHQSGVAPVTATAEFAT